MEIKLAKRRRIRTPVAAGLFYPENQNEILEYLQSFDLKACNGGFAKAIIAPHGAWKYSGELAASVFSAAMGRYNSIKRVVILGPIHDKREKGLFLSNSHYFYTPLGNIPVDKKITEELLFISNYFEINDIPHLAEHSIEVLLPFVKYCFPDASIVPVLMGQTGAGLIFELSQALKTVFTRLLDETLIVVSCNLSSYNEKEKAFQLAEKCLRLILKKESSVLASDILDGRLNACGGALVVSVLDSGLLEKTKAASAFAKMISAIDAENNVVCYNGIYFE